MHPCLHPLETDVPLLRNLGRTHTQAALAQTVQTWPTLAQMLKGLSRASTQTPWTIAPQSGLGLQLQCTTPHAPEPERQWGLHSLTLHASDWAGPWPEGLEPESATAQDVIKLFNPDPEACLNTPAMVCFTTPGWSEGQEWSVLCLFDAVTHKLQSFSLIRVGEWSAEQDSGASVATAGWACLLSIWPT